MVCVSEILFFLIFDLIICCNPIKKGSLVFLIFGICGIGVVARYEVSEIISTNKGDCIEHSPGDYNGSTCHCMCIDIFTLVLGVFFGLQGTASGQYSLPSLP